MKLTKYLKCTHCSGMGRVNNPEYSPPKPKGPKFKKVPDKAILEIGRVASEYRKKHGLPLLRMGELLGARGDPKRLGHFEDCLRRGTRPTSYGMRRDVYDRWLKRMAELTAD